jgi:hypothetical protein
MAEWSDLWHPSKWGGDVSELWHSGYVQGPPTGHLQDTGTQAVNDAAAYRALNTPASDASLTQSYQDTLSGKNPSLAMAALGQETGKNTSQQLGFASGLGGLNAALARRTAADNIGRLNQAAVGQGVMTRAQEIANAQQGLGTQLKTQGDQQLEEQKLSEKAYADQLESQNRTREGNMKTVGSFASGLGSLFAG